MHEHIKRLTPEGDLLSRRTHLGAKRINSELTEPVYHREGAEYSSKSLILPRRAGPGRSMVQANVPEVSQLFRAGRPDCSRSLAGDDLILGYATLEEPVFRPGRFIWVL